jgi:hypothetical protein
VSAEYHQVGTALVPASLAVPLEALAVFEGRRPDAVTLEVSGSKVLARWQDKGVPQQKDWEAVDIATLPPFPAPPARLVANPPTLLKALEDAASCTDTVGARYATQYVQWRGKSGEIAATDGRQLFLQGGFHFPWEDNLLVPRLNALGCRDLPCDGTVEVGRGSEHVVVKVGPWAFYLKVDTVGRFPDVDGAIPKTSAAATRWHLAPEDAAFLAGAMPRMPGPADGPSAVTVDLNGQVCLRSKGEGQERLTEALLARSSYTGKAVRLCVNRLHLARAAGLGLTEVLIHDAGRPVLCSGGSCRYVVMPLDRSAALAPADDAVRISSADVVSVSPARAAGKQKEDATPAPGKQAAITPAPRKRKKLRAGKGRKADADSPAQEEPAGGLGALVEEAAALRALLRDAALRSGKLLDAVKRHRRQTRLVAATLSSLRQLQHIGG